jgi:ribosomal protein L34E
MPSSELDRDLTGQRVGGFLLSQRLGVGGFGAVYRGQPDVGIPRAIKVLHDANLARALRREAETLLALKHPRIVEFVHADLQAEPAFVVMELVEGGTLAERVPLDAERARVVCRGILEGLAHAHTKGVAHLDLKPQNVLLGSDGQPKITDFGLARAVEILRGGLAQSQSASGNPSGTLAYMSPEQREGKRGDLRSDVFSFGVLLCNVVTGKLPQPGDTLEELLGKKPPSWAETIFARCHCRFEKRFAHAAEALAALDTIRTGGTVKCQNCNHENIDTVKFCGECGQPLSTRSSGRLTQVDPVQEESRTPSGRLAPSVLCQFCQEEIAATASKCKHCGATFLPASTKCKTHPDTRADVTCADCNQYFCNLCIKVIQDRKICKECVPEVLGPVVLTNPNRAMLLGFAPGQGHQYLLEAQGKSTPAMSSAIRSLTLLWFVWFIYWFLPGAVKLYETVGDHFRYPYSHPHILDNPGQLFFLLPALLPSIVSCLWAFNAAQRENKRRLASGENEGRKGTVIDPLVGSTHPTSYQRLPALPDSASRPGGAPGAMGSSVSQNQSVNITNVMQGGQSPRWSKGVAALLSLLIPGLGHLYKGQILWGILWFVIAIVAYIVSSVLCFIPGILVHIICIVHSASGNEYA